MTNTLNPEQLRHFMFGQTRRYIGPHQRLVNSYPELMKHMYAQSGLINGFVSVYHIDDHHTPIVDKIFMESDDGTPEQNLKIGQKLFETATETFDIPTVPIWSGNKSPHIFPLLQPEIHQNQKQAIKLLAFLLVYTSNQYDIDPQSRKFLPKIDTKVLEPRRLCRFPAIKRTSATGFTNPNHCVILDPERFPDMSMDEVLEISANPHSHSFKYTLPNNLPKLTSLPIHDIDLSDWRNSLQVSETTAQTAFFDEKRMSNSCVEHMLDKLVTRPCNREAMTLYNPCHVSRISTTSELLQKGVTKEFTKFLYSLLNWFDYDPAITNQSIDGIYQESLFPYGLQKMEESGLCIYDSKSKDCQDCKNHKRKITIYSRLTNFYTS